VHVTAGVKFATPLLAQVIVSVGEAPETTAPHVVGEPVVTGEGEQLTVVAVPSFETRSDELPEAIGLLESLHKLR
jgi:hypothetical protein